MRGRYKEEKPYFVKEFIEVLDVSPKLTISEKLQTGSRNLKLINSRASLEIELRRLKDSFEKSVFLRKALVHLNATLLKANIN